MATDDGPVWASDDPNLPNDFATLAVSPAYPDVVRRYQKGYPAAPSLLPEGLQQMGLGAESWHRVLDVLSAALFGAGVDMWEASRLPVGCMASLPPGFTAKKAWGITVPRGGHRFYIYQDPQGYLDVRLRVGSEEEWTQPVGVHRLMCWWAWGPPPPDRPQACHFCCDKSNCLNPRHLRWGSDSQNRREDHALKKHAAHMRFQERTWQLLALHPTKWMLRHDGFPVQAA